MALKRGSLLPHQMIPLDCFCWQMWVSTKLRSYVCSGTRVDPVCLKVASDVREVSVTRVLAQSSPRFGHTAD